MYFPDWKCYNEADWDQRKIQYGIYTTRKDGKEMKKIRIGVMGVYRGTSMINYCKAANHAEIVAIEEACRFRGGWRLPECTLYVTLEPCPMCGGAIVNARLPRIVFGAYDRRAGAFGSALDLNAAGLNHRPEVVGGVLADECAEVLTSYFRKKR